MSETPKTPGHGPDAPQAHGEPQVFQAATAMFTVPKQAQVEPRGALDEEPQGQAGQKTQARAIDVAHGQVWHVVLGAGQEGPMTLEAVAAKLASGVITPAALVWRAGMANWSPLQEVAEFAALPMATAHDGTAATAQPVLAAMGPAADAALDALMLADAQAHLTPSTAAHAAPVSEAVHAPLGLPQAPAAPNLAGQDLFGANETQFLQVPGTPAAPGAATLSPAVAAGPQDAPSAGAAHPAQASGAPKGASRKVVWAAAGVALLAAAAGAGLLLARPAVVAGPAPLPSSVPAAPAVAAPAANPQAPAQEVQVAPAVAPAPKPAAAAAMSEPANQAPADIRIEGADDAPQPSRAHKGSGHKGHRSSHGTHGRKHRHRHGD